MKKPQPLAVSDNYWLRLLEDKGIIVTVTHGHNRRLVGSYDMTINQLEKISKEMKEKK